MERQVRCWKLAICVSAATLLIVCVGCRVEAPTPQPGTDVGDTQKMLAGMFDVPRDAVTLEGDYAPFAGGDREWAVQVPYREHSITVFTGGGLPRYIREIGVWEEEVPDGPWPDRDQFDGPLSPRERDAARRAGIVIVDMLDLPSLSEEHLELVRVRPLGEDEPPSMYCVLVRITEEPWQQQGMIQMRIGYETPSAAAMIAFGVEEP